VEEKGVVSVEKEGRRGGGEDDKVKEGKGVGQCKGRDGGEWRGRRKEGAKLQIEHEKKEERAPTEEEGGPGRDDGELTVGLGMVNKGKEGGVEFEVAVIGWLAEDKQTQGITILFATCVRAIS
jgi:hypothetical protein